MEDMLAMSDLQEVWATPLYDRPPMPLPPPRRRKNYRERENGFRGEGEMKEEDDDMEGRVTVLGDACHPMSMFKGQGANQVFDFFIVSPCFERLIYDG